MNTKQLTNLNKFHGRTKLPICDLALISRNTITVTNLDTFYQIPHELNVVDTVLIPIREFVKIAKKYRIDSIVTSGDQYIIQTNAGAFTFGTEDLQRYPVIPEPAKGEITLLDGDELKGFLAYVSHDDLRPAMQGVFIGDDIVATDGHRMKFTPNRSAPKPSFIIPKQPVELMTKAAYRVHQAGLNDSNGWMAAISHAPDLEKIWFKPINEVYPNYQRVIPQKKECSYTVTINRKDALSALEAAEISAGGAKTVRLMLNGRVKLTAEDTDLNKSYVSGQIGDYQHAGPKDDPFEIGFDARLLAGVFKDYPDDWIKLHLSSPARAGLVGDDKLVMPVMLKQNH